MYHHVHTEQEILSSLAAGNRKAAEDIYKQHYAMVTGWIQQNGGQAEDAADIYQEAMVILFEKAQNEEFRLSCKVGTYLFAISKHLWLKKLQKKQRQPVFFADDMSEEEGIAYEDDIKAHEEREGHYDQLNAALNQLGEPCRSLLKSFYHHNKSMQHIASEFGYTNPENAKNQKYKCLTRLRKLFYRP